MGVYFFGLLVVWAFVGGCSTDHFETGHGDPGIFILNEAVSRGAQLVATNNLPTICGRWNYKVDPYGLEVKLPAQDYEGTAKLLHDARGKPRRVPEDADGKLVLYRFGTNGGTLQLTLHPNYCSVIVLRPLDNEKIMKAVIRAMKVTDGRQ